MRCVVVALAASAALTGAFAQFAFAADLPPRVPIAPVAYTAPRIWTGFGAHVGGAWGTKDWTTTIGTAFVDDWQHTVNGPLGGLQVGGNYQFDRWVIGAEAQFSWSNLEGKNHCAIVGRDLNCSTKNDWLGIAALRFGLTAGDALVYVKGGAAWARDEYTFKQFVLNAIVSVSDTRWGWMLGTSIEYAVTSNWSARRAGFSSHAVLAMARAQKRLAEKYNDEDLARHAAELERRALDAIEQGLLELPPDEPAGRRALMN
jgi:opacity protein-like surface antigen